MLREFWAATSGGGFHTKDKPFIDERECLCWSQGEASPHAETFKTDKRLHKKLHTNLHPQPFIGNIETASVYILFGNPGLAITDYSDELANPVHAAACATNLRHPSQGFFPLLTASNGTGVANYWNSRLKSLITSLSECLGVTVEEAANG